MLYSQEWFSNDNPNIRAIKAYKHVESVLILDESKQRLVLDVMPMAEFEKYLEDWTEVKE